MTETPPTLRAIHALLDMVVAFDEDASEDENGRAIESAFANLSEFEAITAKFDPDTDVLKLDVGPLLNAIGVIVDTLLRDLAGRLGQDKLTVLNTLRQHLDDVFRED